MRFSPDFQPYPPQTEGGARKRAARISAYRLAAAFIISPAVACSLFVVGFWIIVLPQAAGLQEAGLMVSLTVPYIFATPLTAVISFPIYLVLERLNLLSGWTIVPLASLEGLAIGYAVFNLHGSIDTGTLIGMLSVGLCAAVGGVVFCKMTIWRKPDADGATDV